MSYSSICHHHSIILRSNTIQNGNGVLVPANPSPPGPSLSIHGENRERNWCRCSLTVVVAARPLSVVFSLRLPFLFEVICCYHDILLWCNMLFFLVVLFVFYCVALSANSQVVVFSFVLHFFFISYF